MTVRRASTSDIPQMARMVGRLFSIEADFAVDPERQRRGLAAIVASESAAAFVAEEGGALAGMVTIQLTISTAEGGPSGLLEDLFVEEAFRRSGVAGLLVAEAEAWCSERGGSRVQLLADRDNEGALRFYDAVGYLPTRMIARRRML
jgi:GNAT superfamily N-acetyltransferase